MQEVFTRARDSGWAGTNPYLELSALRHVATRLTKLANRLVWHRRRRAEAILTAAALRAAERATAGVGGRRVRTSKGTWTIRVATESGEVDAVVIERPVRSRFSDFEQPIRLTVVEPSLVDGAELEAWAERVRNGLAGPARGEPARGAA